MLLLVVLSGLWSGAALAADSLEVEITGIEEPALANVRTILAPPADLIKDGVLDRSWLQHYRRRAPERVRRALKPFGYFEPETDLSLDEAKPGQFLFKVRVRPGEPVRVHSVSLRLSGPGRDEPRLEKEVRSFPLQRGEILRQDLYEQAKGALKAKAIDLGYLDARFTRHRLAVTLEGHAADIELELDTGPLFFFGSVLIHGAPDYPDPFLRRYLAFEEGERFSYGRLGQTQVNYLDSDRFRDVILTPHTALKAEQRVPVGIRLVPSDSKRFRPGIGYGTDTGARFSLRYQDLNLFQRGHELDLDLSTAQLHQTLAANYRILDTSDLESYTSLRFEIDREDNETYTSRVISAEAERLRSLGRGMLGSVFVRLHQEDYQVGLTDERSRLVLPGLRFTLRKFSDPVRPTRGYRLFLEARGTHPALGSDTELLQIRGQGNLLWPLPWRLSLLTRASAATTLQSDRLGEIPASLRFFAGGDKSVRGYPYQSLGPRDASGQVVGGKHLLTGSLELERALGKNWGAACFYDVGNAFNEPDRIELAQGVGIGVRYYTAVGPVRVDLARRLGEPSNAFRLHISVGLLW